MAKRKSKKRYPDENGISRTYDGVGVQTCYFVHVSDLVHDIVPKEWRNCFMELIGKNAPFTWGDNNRSLVTADVFADHCSDIFGEETWVNPMDRSRFLRRVRGFGKANILIDMEN